jgi:hypothetical protein
MTPTLLSARLSAELVNYLLTIYIRVNILLCRCDSHEAKRGLSHEEASAREGLLELALRQWLEQRWQRRLIPSN